MRRYQSRVLKQLVGNVPGSVQEISGRKNIRALLYSIVGDEDKYNGLGRIDDECLQIGPHETNIEEADPGKYQAIQGAFFQFFQERE